LRRPGLDKILLTPPVNKHAALITYYTLKASVVVGPSMIKKSIKKARRRSLGEQGSTAIEYGLIAALISLFIMANLNTFGSYVVNTFNKAASKLN
jgi:Flp pilus assembly pilin Flp